MCIGRMYICVKWSCSHEHRYQSGFESCSKKSNRPFIFVFYFIEFRLPKPLWYALVDLTTVNVIDHLDSTKGFFERLRVSIALGLRR